MINYIKCEEKLIRAQLELRRRIKTNEALSKTSETIGITLKTSEHLSIDGKVSLPLKIRGKMLGVGRHKERFYTEKELRWSVGFHQGKSIPIKLDHRDKEVASIVGAIDKLIWDDTEKAVRYEGHINDETQARNILDNVVREVSATIDSIREYDMTLGIMGVQPEYHELSLVVKGAYTGNTLETVV